MLTAENLTFGYTKGKPLLENVSLVVPRGRVLGILGPNGAGKSTLLRLLNRRYRPWEGEIRLDDSPLTQFSIQELARRMAVVPQNPAASFDFTVEELVAMGRRPHHGLTGALSREDRNIAEEAIERTGLQRLRKRPVTLLSGGETQLAFVARALAQQAETMLLDEATASLDIKHSSEILSIIRRRVTEEGLTVAAVVHDVNVALSFCDEIVFLSRGGTMGPDKPEVMVNTNTLQEVYGVASDRVAVYEKPLHVRSRVHGAPRE